MCWHLNCVAIIIIVYSPEPIPLEKLNLPDLVKQIKKQQFTEKKLGIEGLQQLITSVEYTMSEEEIALFKDSLKWLFPESHAKLYIMFLDMLMDFIQVWNVSVVQYIMDIVISLGAWILRPNYHYIQ